MRTGWSPSGARTGRSSADAVLDDVLPDSAASSAAVDIGSGRDVGDEHDACLVVDPDDGAMAAASSRPVPGPSTPERAADAVRVVGHRPGQELEHRRGDGDREAVEIAARVGGNLIASWSDVPASSAEVIEDIARIMDPARVEVGDPIVESRGLAGVAEQLEGVLESGQLRSADDDCHGLAVAGQRQPLGAIRLVIEQMEAMAPRYAA